jgi:hypothetical protein
MAAFEDTFTEASDTLLTLHAPNVGTAWTLDSGDSSNLVVRALNNALVSTSVSRTFVRSDDLGDADCYVEAELSTLNGQNGRYVALRVQDSTNFIGWILAGTGGAGMRLVKVVSGNTTNLFTMQGVAGRVYRVEAEGTTIRFYENGVQQGSDITESSFQTETKQGIVAFNTDSTIDFISTYNADILGSSGTSVVVNSILPSLFSSLVLSKVDNLFSANVNSILPSINSSLNLTYEDSTFDLSLSSELPSLASIINLSTFDIGNSVNVNSILPALSSSLSVTNTTPNFNFNVNSNLPSLTSSLSFYNGILDISTGNRNNINIVVKSTNINVIINSRNIEGY